MTIYIVLLPYASFSTLSKIFNYSIINNICENRLLTFPGRNINCMKFWGLKALVIPKGASSSFPFPSLIFLTVTATVLTSEVADLFSQNFTPHSCRWFWSYFSFFTSCSSFMHNCNFFWIWNLCFLRLTVRWHMTLIISLSWFVKLVLLSLNLILVNCFLLLPTSSFPSWLKLDIIQPVNN